MRTEHTQMHPFITSKGAKSYVVAKILEEAMTEGVGLTNIERKLLNESLGEDEVEAFEHRNDGQDAEAFWEKIAALVRNGLNREKEFGGRPAQRQYEAALQLAVNERDYLAGIIQIEELATATLASKTKRGVKRWLLLLPICILGGIALALILPYVFEASDRISQTRGSEIVRSFLRYRAVPAFFIAVTVTWLFSIVQRKVRQRN